MANVNFHGYTSGGSGGAVDSVNGKTGAVILYGTDIPLSSSDSETITSEIGDINTTLSGLATVATTGDYDDLIDKPSLATVATSGSYADLTNKPTIPAEQVNADWNATSGKARILNKPTIPSAVTESTVSGWGFTKNTGTYSKPSSGIPKTDLASSVQTSLGKADSALQTHQDISGKADKIAVVNHGTSSTTFTLTPNVLHVWGTISSLTLTLGAANNATMDEFMFQFTSGSTATTLSLPEDINWVVTPSINPNKVYQCSIINNVGVIAAANLE